jgi:hypothetical protein
MTWSTAVRIVKRLVIIVSIAYLALLLPEKKSQSFQTALSNPFVWNMDDRWNALEKEFGEARTLNKVVLDSLLNTSMQHAETLLQQLQNDSVVLAGDERLTGLLNHFFAMAPLFAAAKEPREYLTYYNSIRAFVKQQSIHWNLNENRQRSAIYALLYGMRAAVEEVLLQADTIAFNPVQRVTDEPSETPTTMLQGIPVHSGDLLVSRGGAEVSAFISRGNDYPGNFSHVALLYVDRESNTPYFIEAHIEKGVAIATAEEYLSDRKLRFMVLRPRSDLPQLEEDPMLPHYAAEAAFRESNSRHIPYDFKMNFYDSSAMFCSEVGSFAYRQHGLQLWQAESTISSRGTADWLNAFGVENFVTQMPSDLEYDPQLSLVAEWCDPQTLLKDHIDNAVMDALLEKANGGMEIGYNHWMLPVARLVKLYSWIQNRVGSPGIIPEGMTATQALKNNSFVELYQQTRKGTEASIQAFTATQGYRPPYWVMVGFARQSIAAEE